MAYLCWHEYLTLNSLLYWIHPPWQSEGESRLAACSGWTAEKRISVSVKGYQVTNPHRPAAEAGLMHVTPYAYRSPTSPVGGVWHEAVKKPGTKKRKESELEAICIEMYTEPNSHTVSDISQIFQAHFHGQCFALVVNESIFTATQNNVGGQNISKWLPV